MDLLLNPVQLVVVIAFGRNLLAHLAAAQHGELKTTFVGHYELSELFLVSLKELVVLHRELLLALLQLLLEIQLHSHQLASQFLGFCATTHQFMCHLRVVPLTVNHLGLSLGQ